MTNGDKIRQMTNKELARLIDLSLAYFNCKDCKHGKHIGKCEESCVESIESWLDEKAEKDWYLNRTLRYMKLKQERGIIQ